MIRPFVILFATAYFQSCLPAWNPVDELRYARPSHETCNIMWTLEGRYDDLLPEIMTACERCFVRPAEDEDDTDTDSVMPTGNPERRA